MGCLMETRICKVCETKYPIESFEITSEINGKKYRRRKCNKCRQIVKNKRRKTIKEGVINYKKKNKCFMCEVSDYRVLEFHHIKDDKVDNVSDMVRRGFSYDNIMNEIKKCKVVCANCHKIIHYNE